MIDIGVGVYNSNLEFIGEIIQINSLQTVKNLQSASTISLNVDLVQENITLLNTSNFLILNSETTEDAEIYKIQYVQKNLNSDGSTSLVVQGRNLWYIFSYRALTQIYNFNNANVGDIITEMITNECIKCKNPNRIYTNLQLGNLTLNESINYINPLASYSNPSLDDILDTSITNVLQAVGIGLQVKANLNTKIYTVSFIIGRDLTLESDSDNPIVLSNALNNITSEQFTLNTTNYTNVCYVSGTVNNVTEQVMCIKGSTEASGYARQESATSCEIEGLNTKDYLSQYQAIGQSYIASQDIFKNSSVELNIDNTNYKFNEDFKLGDLITFISEEWNIKESIEVCQVTETWSDGGYSVSLQLGKEQPTLAKILKMR
ncbi:Gp37-like protein [uncultured Clostridium sp.]|uniref:Gp37-like protein n=1 Tax=uncultured Clostridium sp. TaxID=59620 RepID=UPI002588F757|nr:hypothetical protein [uncultured Clostridium sp.]